MPTTYTFTLRAGVTLQDAHVDVYGSRYDVDAALIAGGGSIVTADETLAQALKTLRADGLALLDVNGVTTPGPGSGSPLYPLFTAPDDYADGEVPTWDDATQRWLPGSAATGSAGKILPWVTATAYVQGQGVTNGGRTYLAVDAHTSGATFSGDSAHWSLLPVLPSTVAGGSLGASPSLNVAAQANPLDVIYTGTLTANATLTITGLAAGARLRILLTQDGTGGRTFSITVGGSTAAVTVDLAASASSVADAVYDGTDLYVRGA